MVKYIGFKNICPICGMPSRDWTFCGSKQELLLKVIGGGYRKAVCVYCRSNDRERLLYTYLKFEYGLFKNDCRLRFLHVAPETRLYNKFRGVDRFDYIVGDYFMPGYNYPKHTIHLDVTNIEYPDDCFDLILCNHVLEHIPTDERAMKEILRVLRPGGLAILQVPISETNLLTIEDVNCSDPKERLRRFGQMDHLRIYGQDYPLKLESVGFKVTKVNISGKYRRYGLNPKEQLFLCSKSHN